MNNLDNWELSTWRTFKMMVCGDKMLLKQKIMTTRRTYIICLCLFHPPKPFDAATGRQTKTRLRPAVSWVRWHAPWVIWCRWISGLHQDEKEGIRQSLWHVLPDSLFSLLHFSVLFNSPVVVVKNDHSYDRNLLIVLIFECVSWKKGIWGCGHHRCLVAEDEEAPHAAEDGGGLGEGKG